MKVVITKDVTKDITLLKNGRIEDRIRSGNPTLKHIIHEKYPATSRWIAKRIPIGDTFIVSNRTRVTEVCQKIFTYFVRIEHKGSIIVLQRSIKRTYQYICLCEVNQYICTLRNDIIL